MYWLSNLHPGNPVCLLEIKSTRLSSEFLTLKLVYTKLLIIHQVPASNVPSSLASIMGFCSRYAVILWICLSNFQGNCLLYDFNYMIDFKSCWFSHCLVIFFCLFVCSFVCFCLFVCFCAVMVGVMASRISRCHSGKSHMTMLFYFLFKKNDFPPVKWNILYNYL